MGLIRLTAAWRSLYFRYSCRPATGSAPSSITNGEQKNHFSIICHDGWSESIIFAIKQLTFCLVPHALSYPGRARVRGRSDQHAGVFPRHSRPRDVRSGVRDLFDLPLFRKHHFISLNRHDFGISHPIYDSLCCIHHWRFCFIRHQI